MKCLLLQHLRNENWCNLVWCQTTLTPNFPTLCEKQALILTPKWIYLFNAELKAGDWLKHLMRFQDVFIELFLVSRCCGRVLSDSHSCICQLWSKQTLARFWVLVCLLHKSGHIRRVAVKLLPGLFEFLEAKLDDSWCQKHWVTKAT